MLASFEFDGCAALGPREEIANLTDSNVSIRLYRRMRTEPMSGMWQPLLNSAIMGLDTVLEIIVNGKAAVNHRWRLIKSGRTIQRGICDEHGQCSEVDISLADKPERYRLEVLAPIRP